MKTECWSCNKFNALIHVAQDGVSKTAICTRNGAPAAKRCAAFTYEPGSDEAEAQITAGGAIANFNFLNTRGENG